MVQIPLERLAATTSSCGYDAIDWTTPIDRSRYYLCETQTPLFYTGVYEQLSQHHQRRYNQLTGMLNNELIDLLETELLSSVLRALEDTPGDRAFASVLRQFRDDEARHAAAWRRLNRLSEPDWYRGGSRRFVRVPSAAVAVARMLARRPTLFPVVFWIQLALEERSIDMSRRCAQLPPRRLEPRYAAIYHAHLQDEVRHVQIDCHLIERFYRDATKGIRWTTAALFERLVGSVLLVPAYSSTVVVNRLAHEHPELAPLVPRMIDELRRLETSDDYHAMMYSRRTTPLTFGLFDGFPEFRRIGRTLRSYRPQ